MQGSAPSLKRAPLPRAVQGRAPASCRPAAPLVPAGLHFLPSPPPLFAGRLPPLTGYQAAPSLLSFAPRISPQFYSLPHVTHRVKLHLRRVTHTHTGAPSPATGRQRPTEERQPGSKRRARRGPHGKRRALTENAERPAGGGNGRARRQPPRKEPSDRGNERSRAGGRGGGGKSRAAAGRRERRFRPGAARKESAEPGGKGSEEAGKAGDVAETVGRPRVCPRAPAEGDGPTRVPHSRPHAPPGSPGGPTPLYPFGDPLPACPTAAQSLTQASDSHPKTLVFTGTTWWVRCCGQAMLPLLNAGCLCGVPAMAEHSDPSCCSSTPSAAPFSLRCDAPSPPCPLWPCGWPAMPAQNQAQGDSSSVVTQISP